MHMNDNYFLVGNGVGGGGGAGGGGGGDDGCGGL